MGKQDSLLVLSLVCYRSLAVKVKQDCVLVLILV